MRRAILVCTLTLAVPLAASADALSDLRMTLGRLSGTTPIRGSLEVASNAKSDDDARPREGRVIIPFEADDQGLRIVYPRPILQQAAAEAQGRAADADRPAPVRTGLRQVQPLNLADLIDASAALRLTLQSAQLLSAKPTNYKGKAARLLVFKIQPKLAKAQAKRMKKLDMRLSVWVGDDGVPLGAEQLIDAKASFLMLSFVSVQKESWTFARVGDRLVATRHEQDEKSDGLGQHQVERVVSTVTVQ